MWPAPGSTTVREFGSAAASALPALCGGHHVAFAEDQRGRDGDLCRRGERVLIGVAGGEIVEQHAGPAVFKHALRAGMHPQTRREAAAEFRLIAEAPDRDHVDGVMVVGFGGLEQIGADRHGGRGSDQAEAGNFCRMPGGGLERNQRSHGMTDQPCLGDAGGVEQRRGPVGHVGNGRQRRAGRAAMAGQIRRQHAIAVMREPPAMQGPGGVIEAGAVQEHDGGERGVEFRGRRWRRRCLCR